MKNIHQLIIVFLLSCLMVQPALSKDKKDKKAEFKATLNLIDSLSFKFVADRSHSSAFPSVDLFSHHNYLKIIGDSACAYLPFYGEAYNIGYTNESGVQFCDKMQDWDKKINERKHRITIKIKVRTVNDSFECVLDIGRSGHASLSVISRNRKFIDYTGKIYALEDED